MSSRTRLFVAIVSCGMILYLAVGALLDRVLGDDSYGQLAVFNEVVRLVADGYVEPIDVDRTLGGAQRGLLEALDGDSALLDGEAYRAWREGGTGGDAEVGVTLTRRFGFLMVAGVRSGSPAAELGLRPGDILRSIDGRHSRPLSVPVGQRLLRGEPGSTVQIELLRAGVDPEDKALSRETLSPVGPLGRVVEPGVGLLQLEDFDAQTARRARTELELLKRQGAEQLVLDLRKAGFGDPQLGVELAQLFVADGVLARRDGRKVPAQVWNADPTQVAWRGPVAVLIDTGTSGPGEVVAAALQGSGVELVGRPSFGRAGVQKALPLPVGGILLTVATYLTPAGEPIHGVGLQPGVPVRRTAPGTAEQGDPVLDAALQHLREKPAAKKAA